MKKENLASRVGWFASIMAILLYISYFDQISRNLAGNKGSLMLAIATTINSSSWVVYGYLRQKKDWQIIICNLFGVIVGLITAITSF